MKRILFESGFTAEQLNTIKELAVQCNLCTDTVKILYGRGITSREEINCFLHPSKSHFISPFKMGGMRAATELIKRARDEEWCVVVYGDYDADGVCASTIMGNALKDFGIDPVLVIPERRDGYGLSKELIDDIFEKYFPQLIITVDCGISCAAEVEYIKEQGAEVIVTDHHELPDTIPDCICINPKFNDGYPYDNLCGAGVAFKVGCALLGEEAYKYLDFAAIATVADSVPLTGENRDIVAEGLKIINANPRSCYSQFYKQEGDVTSHTLAFSIAPKINAAGRMGDARSALDLFNSQSESAILDLAAKLTAYNTERQKYCDELYVSAKEKLAAEGVDGNIIVLTGEDWNSGFIGIVAARLADEYSRPVILFVRHGDIYRGSARSVENVNIFEALKYCEQYLYEYGGHSQAAGVSVRAEVFADFKKAITQYISQKYSAEDFIPTVYISGVLSGEYSPAFARELELLQPFGVGNKRPVFLLEEGASQVRAGKGSPHLTIKSDKIELMYFGGGRFTRLAESGAAKSYIFEYNVSHFRGKEYVKGFVRDMVYDKSACRDAGEEAALVGVFNLALPPAECEIVSVSKQDIQSAMSACPPFGTLFVASGYAAAMSFEGAEKLDMELFLPSLKCCASGILLSPQADADLSGYGRIIYLDGFPVNNPSLQGKRVEVFSEARPPEFIKLISTDRRDLLAVYAALCANVASLRGATPEEAAKSNNLGCTAVQAAFALAVFEELKLISFQSGAPKVFKGIKTDLSNSDIYNTACKLQAEADR